MSVHRRCRLGAVYFLFSLGDIFLCFFLWCFKRVVLFENVNGHWSHKYFMQKVCFLNVLVGMYFSHFGHCFVTTWLPVQVLSCLRCHRCFEFLMHFSHIIEYFGGLTTLRCVFFKLDFAPFSLYRLFRVYVFEYCY